MGRPRSLDRPDGGHQPSVHCRSPSQSSLICRRAWRADSYENPQYRHRSGHEGIGAVWWRFDAETARLSKTKLTESRVRRGRSRNEKESSALADRVHSHSNLIFSVGTQI